MASDRQKPEGSTMRNKLQRVDLHRYLQALQKDVEAIARLVTCLQPTGSKNTWHTKAENMSKKS